MAVMSTHCVSVGIGCQKHFLVITNCVNYKTYILVLYRFYDDPDTLPGPAVSGLAT